MVAKKPLRLRTLKRKLRRDMRQNSMLFLAIVLLCALGTWCFSGLDATWRMLDLSTSTYFEQTNLPDFWLNAPTFSRDDLTRLRHLPGIDTVQARTTMLFDVDGLEDDTELQAHLTEGVATLCTPLVTSGEAMQSTDRRGCMLDDQFAAANGLSVGDSVTLKVMGESRSFVIRALIKSSEHLITAREVTPDPLHYGFIYLSSQAMPGLPLTEALVRLSPGADADEVEALIEDLLPSCLVVTRGTHVSTMRTTNDTNMFRSLCYVFPVMAFAVASLVSMTTLTRMMEGQRTQMGTLKALGYPDRRIRRHYLSYALYPSLIGALLGMLTGQYTLPYVLWNMEAAHFIFPWQMHAPISPLCWLIAVLAVCLSLLICLRAYNKAGRETTASLLRPKPPKAGNRILLERVTPFWRRLSFNGKMIVRNLFRNKGRTLMSLIGMLCCNMLIICTLGLTDSINYFVGQYYGGTLQYDLRANLSDNAGTLESYQRRLDAERVEGVMEISASIRSGTVIRTGLVTVMCDNQTLLNLGEDAAYLPMPENGVILSQKLASVLQTGLGETLEIWLPGDDEPVYLTIAALADTNISQGVFINKTQWEALHKGAFMPTALLLRSPTELTRHRLEEMDEVTSFDLPSEQFTQTMKLMDSTSVAFSIMSGVALGLAFVICYNMGLMSFTERTRDYATLKVLGYHQKEIRRLMLRENDLTALLGVALGIPPGVLLTRVVLKSCESESMVYASNVTVQSIVIASVVTFAFTWLIEWLLTRKVRSIDMVEALKSVE